MSAPALRPYARGSDALWVPTGNEAAAFDRRAIEVDGLPGAVLMENAGRAAAHLVQRLHPSGEVLAVVGRGNNGGDALVALRTLAAWGRPVLALLVGERAWPDPLLHRWAVPVDRDEDLTDEALARRLGRAGVLLDGLLGTGLEGPPRARQARVIRALGAAGPPVVALDVPSGVDADDGSVPGDAVRADLTVAFGWPKLGVLLHPARTLTGRLVAAEIGFPPPTEPSGAWLITPGWGASRRPRRAPATHKNRVGAMLLLAGSQGMAGAAVLAARAALRSGVGYLRVASDPANREILQEALPDAAFVDMTEPDALQTATESSRAVAVGPGLGTSQGASDALDRVLEASRGRLPGVIDADALNMLAGDPDRLAVVGDDGSRVLTPHPGEMARLLAASVAEVEAARPTAARDLAERVGGVVVLKGAPTLVAEPGGRLGVSGVGGSELAVAGMGDVLTGTIGGLLAQGVTPADAAALALLATARAAARVGASSGLLASDLPPEIPAALEDLGPGSTDLAEPWVLLDLDPAR